MTRKSLLLLTVLFVALAEAVAQQEPEIPKLDVTVDVRVINLDVVVTDKRGNVVTGLKKEDFQIFENGKPKEISNFYEVRSAEIFAPKTEEAAVPGAKPEVPHNCAGGWSSSSTTFPWPRSTATACSSR